MNSSFYFEPMLENPMALDRLDIRFRWGHYGIRVLRCHLTTFPPGVFVDFHHHSEFEFHFIPRGKGKVILEGQTFSLQEDMLYVTGPGIPHYQEADRDEAMDELCLHVDIRLIDPDSEQSRQQDAAWGESMEIEEAEACIRQLSLLPAIPVPDTQDAMQWFLTAFTAWRDNRLGLYTVLKQAIIQMLLRTVEAYKLEQPKFELPSRDMKSHRFQLAVHFIQDNFGRPLTLESVSERVRISPRQLQRIFKDRAGVTFSDFVEQIRLTHVCEDLTHSRLKLEQIAARSGFTTSNYLHYVFKKKLGMTPMAYREMAGRNMD